MIIGSHGAPLTGVLKLALVLLQQYKGFSLFPLGNQEHQGDKED
ncbi:MAG: hypothetical protein PWQ18_999 [Clostridia bacterium]|nr:hypothetical protein [Clostridia bacterium]